MKSKIAKDELDYNRCHVCDGVLEYGHRVGCDELVYYATSIKAIEIAEQEIMEKAVQCHIKACSRLSGDNRCYNRLNDSYEMKCDGNCDYVKRFKEYMK